MGSLGSVILPSTQPLPCHCGSVFSRGSQWFASYCCSGLLRCWGWTLGPCACKMEYPNFLLYIKGKSPSSSLSHGSGLCMDCEIIKTFMSNEKTMWELWGEILFYFVWVSVCARTCVCAYVHVLSDAFGGQRATLWSWFSPFILPGSQGSDSGVRVGDPEEGTLSAFFSVFT